MSLRRLEAAFHDRPWGADSAAPLFPDRPERLGEVWYSAPDLLIKFLFTAESLSVQVHPDDAQAQALEGKPYGKTEMWHILEAKEDAQIALGFDHHVSQEDLKDAMGKETFLQLLQWIPVTAGDTFYVPAGTVHAIGAGITLCEVQQPSDITYRLYDFRAGRELHIERGLKVSRVDVRPQRVTPTEVNTTHRVLVDSPFFRTELLTIEGGSRALPKHQYAAVLSGSGNFGHRAFSAGEVWQLDGDLTVHADEPTEILLASASGTPAV